jgi:poly-gamma-glutamate synthesis protein (capsule biosynthesis protein)
MILAWCFIYIFNMRALVIVILACIVVGCGGNLSATRRDTSFAIRSDTLSTRHSDTLPLTHTDTLPADSADTLSVDSTDTLSSAGADTSALARPDTLTVIAVGDVMFANHGTRFLDSLGIAYPLAKIRDELLAADIRYCNLESPVSDTGEPFDKTYTFLTPVRHAGVLRDGGFDAAHLANNHILDNGEIALSNTLKVLDSMGIAHCGAGKNLEEARRPAVVEKKGLKIGFLGYSNTFPEEFWAGKERPGTAFGHARYLDEDIPRALSQVDLLIVSFHWGAEKMEYPKDYQRELGRHAVDLGAHAVIGHHPHVLQGIEIYKGRPIAYSLGNFCFATWTNAVWDSAIFKMFFENGRFLKAEIIPVLINNFQVEFQTRRLKGAKAEKSLKKFAGLCDSVGTQLVIEGATGWIFSETPANIE